MEQNEKFSKIYMNKNLNAINDLIYLIKKTILGIEKN